ncbi:MAG: LysM peptidoglycan-binding domain-containing protein [Chloroflexi bacterium]|nr:LysM peptidoglycan-binding domain-containing protein [Chloroflexota bacterium]
MKKLVFVFALVNLVLASCSFSLFRGDTTAASDLPLATPTIAPTTIELAVQANPSTLPAAGQIIKYTYTVKNTGAAAVPGTIAITGAVTCPQINTIGNQDGAFDPGEIFTCTSEYAVTADDVNRGSVSSMTTATVSGIISNSVTTTVSKPPASVLNLVKTANPVNYSQSGQTITYTYVIMNSGATTLGPAQFTVTDSAFSTPVNCGDPTVSLNPTATLSCTASYVTTQADVDTGSITTNATASGGGATTAQPATLTITKGTTVVVPPSNPNLTAGSTIQHKVVTGEWLWQIARCYGADPSKTLQANPQLPNPAYISPDTTVTVPNIGSVGGIYGPPCIGSHTVQAGETWASIAQKYNADPYILQIVNAYDLTVGRVLKVPLNSAGGVLPVGK